MANADRLTHAGGVVYRLIDGKLEFLLVTARRRPSDWVLPKGRIERGESPEEAAVREVQEESGVIAAIKKPLEDVRVLVNDEPQRVRFFLMQRVHEGSSSEGRDVAWLARDEAVRRVTFANAKTLIDSGYALLAPRPGDP